MSFGASAASGMTVSGRLTPLRFDTLPPTSTKRDDALRRYFGRDQPQLAVVDEERIARLDRGKDFRMRQLHALGVAGRRIGVEHEVLTLVDLGRAVLEGAEPQLRALQIDQDADRPAVFGFDRADRGHQFAHPLVIGVAHIDAKHVGAGLEQPADHVAIAGSRTERRHDFGAPLPPHCVWPRGTLGAA